MPMQDGWRYCGKCHAMFYDGYPDKGHCASGVGHAVVGYSYNFSLPWGDDPEDANHQRGWRYCGKCHAMFFDGYPYKGHCPAGGGHGASGWEFRLPHDVPDSPLDQGGWRYCGKCHAMFFDGYPDKGVCPGGGGHAAEGFVFVLKHDSVKTFDAGPLTCGLPLGGSAHLACQSNGAYTLTGHAHDSGFDTIQYAWAAALVTPAGIAFTFAHQGRVEGTSAGLPFGTPRRDDHFTLASTNS
ncbi:hypothetical protein [Mycobacterium vicinigordonae]|uniref:Uncharacterized protein n=1 Tax=Mycobacterium vicinigordonae TaxID=1719132 RepID=A0A7D6ECJ1_9MYCO|nr:hypothetical protein [Mycobacterium vicinigordonae]QLL09665.1 hypothetical protein H0P51_12815 [Mycobacterium vicinigordonae]